MATLQTFMTSFSIVNNMTESGSENTRIFHSQLRQRDMIFNKRKVNCPTRELYDRDDVYQWNVSCYQINQEFFTFLVSDILKSNRFVKLLFEAFWLNNQLLYIREITYFRSSRYIFKLSIFLQFNTIQTSFLFSVKL